MKNEFTRSEVEQLIAIVGKKHEYNVDTSLDEKKLLAEVGYIITYTENNFGGYSQLKLVGYEKAQKWINK